MTRGRAALILSRKSKLKACYLMMSKSDRLVIGYDDDEWQPAGDKMIRSSKYSQLKIKNKILYR
jgi:hypothetical protein